MTTLFCSGVTNIHTCKLSSINKCAMWQFRQLQRLGCRANKHTYTHTHTKFSSSIMLLVLFILKLFQVYLLNWVVIEANFPSRGNPELVCVRSLVINLLRLVPKLKSTLMHDYKSQFRMYYRVNRNYCWVLFNGPSICFRINNHNPSTELVLILRWPTLIEIIQLCRR